MFTAIMVLGALAAAGFILGTFFGGRNPTATPPAAGAGVWANIRYILDAFGDGIRDASTYVLIILAVIVVSVELNLILRLPPHALVLAIALVGLGTLVFVANASEAQKREQGVKSGKAITKAGLIALAILIIVLGFDGWVPTHLSALPSTVKGMSGNGPKSMKEIGLWLMVGAVIVMLLLGVVIVLKETIFKKSAAAPAAATPHAAPAAPAAPPHHP